MSYVETEKGPKPESPNEHLRRERHRRGWSQQEVADRIETTPLNVGRWESGKTVPHPHFRMKLCELFEKTEAELGFVARKESTAEEGMSDHRSFAMTPLLDPTLPSYPTASLVGRSQILASLREKLQRNGTLLVLHGLPGVGKTALVTALTYVDEITTHFSDGILWAGLGPDPDLTRHLSRWGTLLGLSEQEMRNLDDLEAWAFALHRAIGTRSFLLVIDDVWKQEDALALKIGGRQCATVITTRFLPVAAQLTSEEIIAVQELDETESLALLGQLAPQVIERERAQLQELLHAIGGLPLALTLIGKYLRVQSMSGHPRRIHSALEHLRSAEARLHLEDASAPGERHPSLAAGTSLSLQAIIAVTDRHLDELARSAFYALSVFPAKPVSFSEEAALAVAASSVDALDTLVDAGLLEYSYAGRYTMHQTIADYARLAQKGERATERLILYVHTFVGTYRAAYDHLEQESPLIHMAIRAAEQLAHDTMLVSLVTAFIPFLLTRGQSALALEYIALAEAAAHLLQDSEGLVRLFFQRAEVLSDQCAFEQAALVAQEGLVLARQLEYDRLCGQFLYLLGFQAFFGPEDLLLAARYFEEGLALSRNTHDAVTMCKIIRFLATIHRLHNDFATATTLFNEGITLARHHPLGEGVLGGLLMNLAIVLEYQGAYDAAKAHLQEALTLARAEKNLGGIGSCLCNLGNLEMHYDHDAEALPLFEEGLKLARQWDRGVLIAYFTWGLGTIATREKRLEQAKLLLEESFAVWTTIDRETGHLWTPLSALADYQLVMGQIDLAEQTFHNALDQLTAQGETLDLEAKEIQARICFGLARAAQTRHADETAEHWIEQGLHLCEQLHLPFPFVQDIRQCATHLK